MLKILISIFCTPTHIVIDNGTCVTSKTTKDALDSWNIELHLTKIPTHSSNGQVERFMKTIEIILRVESYLESDWPIRFNSQLIGQFIEIL